MITLVIVLTILFAVGMSVAALTFVLLHDDLLEKKEMPVAYALIIQGVPSAIFTFGGLITVGKDIKTFGFLFNVKNAFINMLLESASIFGIVTIVAIAILTIWLIIKMANRKLEKAR